MSCEPKDCFVVRHSVSDPRLDTFQNQTGDTRAYAMPAPDSGYYNALAFPAMRERFATEAFRAMSAYPKTEEAGCGEGCGCSASIDPKDAMTVQRRVKVVADFTYPDGGTATLTGSFLLTSVRTKGFCTEGVSAVDQAAPKVKGRGGVPEAGDAGAGRECRDGAQSGE